MPEDSSPVKSKPMTRGSLRQSLNLASMSKAFADVMNKDKDATKNTKKTKDTSRRSSALPSGPRASMGDVRPPSQVSKRTSTPESKTVTRRRVSATHARSSSDEQSSKLSEPPNGPQATAPVRTSTLRPKNLNATSALPKYRPKSVILEAAKPPSPVRAGTRRRLSSTSEDEKKEQKPVAASSPAEKNSRPISPLPHRAALKANLTNSITATPSPTKPKISTPLSVRTSPSRPTKIVKTAPPTSTIPRPPSSSSSLLSLPHTPKKSTPKVSTPKTSGLKANLGLSRSSQDKNTATITPSHGSPSPFSRDSPSPLARRSRKGSNFTTPASSMVSGNMSHISEGTSEDSDAEDVELLLAPVAAIGAPTPAMPRIQTSRKRVIPHTPTRHGLPGRADMSYLSPPLPDSANKSSSSLRPPQRQTPDNQMARGSILSWEQLANEASVNMGEDEFGRMLSEIPAPFRSGAASPSLSSQMDIPESPCLSAIDSPGGFGSISQVLLPDVTPSPAMHNSSIQSRFNLPSDAAVADSSTSTMLRLQLAAAENTARERLFQIQAMEEEIHELKQAHAHQMEESQKQMVYMEVQWREKDAQASYSASLEDKLRHLEVSHERMMEESLKRCQQNALKTQSLVLKAEGLRCEAVCSARLAASSWSAVHDTCEVELDLIRDDKAVFSLLLMQLDQMYNDL